MYIANSREATEKSFKKKVDLPELLVFLYEKKNVSFITKK